MFGVVRREGAVPALGVSAQQRALVLEERRTVALIALSLVVVAPAMREIVLLEAMLQRGAAARVVLLRTREAVAATAADGR